MSKRIGSAMLWFQWMNIINFFSLYCGFSKKTKQTKNTQTKLGLELGIEKTEQRKWLVFICVGIVFVVAVVGYVSIVCTCMSWVC